MKSFLLTKLLPALVLTFTFSSLALAQQDPDSGGTSPLDPASPTGVPIDGGASLLLAGGVAYGIKKLRNRRRAA